MASSPSLSGSRSTSPAASPLLSASPTSTITQLQVKQAINQLRSSVFQSPSQPSTTTSKTSPSPQKVPTIEFPSPTSPSKATTTPPNSIDKNAIFNAPNQSCRPWSLNDYLVRVQSFREISKWFGKPDRIGPLFVARYGWSLMSNATDTLECQTCRAIACFPTMALYDPVALFDASEKFRSELKAKAHHAHCPWMNNPCSPKFAYVQISPAGEVLNALSNRASVLINNFGKLLSNNSKSNLGNNLPHIRFSSAFMRQWREELESYQTPNLDEFITDLFNSLVSKEGNSIEFDVPTKHAVVILAVCGWSVVQNSPINQHCLFCATCRRVVGVWNYVGTLTQEAVDAVNASSYPGNGTADMELVGDVESSEAKPNDDVASFEETRALVQESRTQKHEREESQSGGDSEEEKLSQGPSKKSRTGEKEEIENSTAEEERRKEKENEEADEEEGGGRSSSSSQEKRKKRTRID
eukprot:TRINITY_DN3484_c0_g1_i3.p1 TRINITY_DN3484_c0_g1~~TRINITY_DN3484_c0_g1_i3.p1  ORF type:complete len:468 (-),score=93.82 TRINITY_DN3484_c0_g1_i3:905-2308(-)